MRSLILLLLIIKLTVIGIIIALCMRRRRAKRAMWESAIGTEVTGDGIESDSRVVDEFGLVRGRSVVVVSGVDGGSKSVLR